MRKIAWLLVVCMLVSMFPLASAHWADAEVEYLVEKGVLTAEDPMLQNPDAPITRIQIVRVAMQLLGCETPEEGKQYFSDVPLDHEDYASIAKAAENRVINGFPDGTFRGDETVTRQDYFTIIGRAYALTGETEHTYADDADVAEYSRPYLKALHAAGLVKGYPDGRINPHGYITVAEALAILKRADEYNAAQEPEITPEEEKEETKPNSGGGGGSGGGGSSSNVIVPQIDYRLSSEKEGETSVLISLGIVSNRNIVEYGCFIADKKYTESKSGRTFQYSETESAYYQPSSHIDLSDPDLDLSLHTSAVGGGEVAGALEVYRQCRIIDDLGKMLEINNNQIVAKENGWYYVYAIDDVGNLAVQYINIDNIKGPSANMTLVESGSSDAITDILVEFEENPEAPIERVVFFPYALLGYDSKTSTLSYNAWVEFMIQFHKNSILTEFEKKERYTVRQAGMYAICLVDTNGNYYLDKIEVPESKELNAMIAANQNYGYVVDSEACYNDETQAWYMNITMLTSVGRVMLQTGAHPCKPTGELFCNEDVAVGEEIIPYGTVINFTVEDAPTGNWKRIRTINEIHGVDIMKEATDDEIIADGCYMVSAASKEEDTLYYFDYGERRTPINDRPIDQLRYKGFKIVRADQGYYTEIDISNEPVIAGSRIADVRSTQGIQQTDYNAIIVIKDGILLCVFASYGKSEPGSTIYWGEQMDPSIFDQFGTGAATPPKEEPEDDGTIKGYVLSSGVGYDKETAGYYFWLDLIEEDAGPFGYYTVTNVCDTSGETYFDEHTEPAINRYITNGSIVRYTVNENGKINMIDVIADCEETLKPTGDDKVTDGCYAVTIVGKGEEDSLFYYDYGTERGASEETWSDFKTIPIASSVRIDGIRTTKHINWDVDVDIVFLQSGNAIKATDFNAIIQVEGGVVTYIYTFY